MTLLKTFPFFIFTIMLSACGTSKQTTETYWVNSAKVNCDAGAGKTTCLQWSQTENYENAEWSNLYTPIKGFNFEPGYLQKIEVLKTTLDKSSTPADASSLHYELVKVLEKKQDPKLAIHDIWVATHINEEAITATPKVPTLEINTTKMQVYGTNGCNNYTGQIKKINSYTINFGAMASTKKMCMDMTIPDRFDKALQSIATYKKEANTLSFFNALGEEVLKLKKGD